MSFLQTLSHLVNTSSSHKNSWIVCGFAQEFLWSGGKHDRPGQKIKDSASLVVCTQKIFLLGGCRFFVSDVISGGLLAHLGHFSWP